MKDYFVFCGQRASTGKPNRISGRMSFYGVYLRFRTKKAALEYVKEHKTPYVGNICVAGTRRSLRKYDLGISQRGYDQNLDALDFEE